MFPTHVGIARPPATNASSWCDVPYACGDCATPHPVNIIGAECSLRMWGLRGRLRRGERQRYMFPTHVGIARDTRKTYNVGSNVPYACGDCAPRTRRQFVLGACSLRMWGLRVPIFRHAQTTEMFPTHVGIARMVSHG